MPRLVRISREVKRIIQRSNLPLHDTTLAGQDSQVRIIIKGRSGIGIDERERERGGCRCDIEILISSNRRPHQIAGLRMQVERPVELAGSRSSGRIELDIDRPPGHRDRRDAVCGQGCFGKIQRDGIAIH